MNATLGMLNAHGLGDTPEARWERAVNEALADSKVIDELSGYLSDEQLTTQSIAISKIISGNQKAGEWMLDDLYRPLVEQKLKDEGRKWHEEAEEEAQRERRQNQIERINNIEGRIL